MDMTVPQVAEALGVSRVRVHQLIALGRLKGGKKGRDWWLTSKSVEAYKASPRKAGRPPKDKPR